MTMSVTISLSYYLMHRGQSLGDSGVGVGWGVGWGWGRGQTEAASTHCDLKQRADIHMQHTSVFLMWSNCNHLLDYNCRCKRFAREGAGGRGEFVSNRNQRQRIPGSCVEFFVAVALANRAELVSSWSHCIPNVGVNWPAPCTDILFDYFQSSPWNGGADVVFSGPVTRLCSDSSVISSFCAPAIVGFGPDDRDYKGTLSRRRRRRRRRRRYRCDMMITIVATSEGHWVVLERDGNCLHWNQYCTYLHVFVQIIGCVFVWLPARCCWMLCADG